jgi:hypothetical protein
VKHCVERYGRAEVEQWYWEVWNEPNLPAYWRGSPEEFYKLHDFAVAAVRRALPTARVGGPDVAGSGGTFMDGFLRHVVSGPNFATGVGSHSDRLSLLPREGLADVRRRARADGDREPARDDRSGILEDRRGARAEGEADRDRRVRPEGCAACQGASLGYRNGTMYSSYTAAVFARKHELAALRGVNLEGALTWAFEFEDQPYFAGFRALMSNGIDLPVLNVFRMFAQMGGQRVATESSAQVPLARIVASGVRDRPTPALGDPRVGGRPACRLEVDDHELDLGQGDGVLERRLERVREHPSLPRGRARTSRLPEQVFGGQGVSLVHISRAEQGAGASSSVRHRRQVQARPRSSTVRAGGSRSASPRRTGRRCP